VTVGGGSWLDAGLLARLLSTQRDARGGGAGFAACAARSLGAMRATPGGKLTAAIVSA